MKNQKILNIVVCAALMTAGIPAFTDSFQSPSAFSAYAAEALSAPRNITVSVSNGTATIKWDKVKGADAYRVYQYDSKTKKYIRIKTVSGTKASIKLSEGKYYFKIAAVKKSGKKYTEGKLSAKINVIMGGTVVTSSGVAENEISDNKTPENNAQQTVPVSEKTSSMTAVQVAKAMGKGWNLGNTMEAVATWLGSGATAKDYEKAWGQPTTTKEMITELKKAGFSSVRVPVAWSNMMPDDGKYTISKSYFDRVDEIIGYVLDNDMYCVINIHWDGGWWEDFGSSESKVSTAAMEKYKSMWSQIAAHYANYSDKLIFESANEELGDATKGKSSLDESYRRVNNINQTFVDVVRSSGGNNSSRFLLIAGYNTSIDMTSDSRFKMPSDTVKDHLLISVHYYDPSTFCIADDPKNSWGYMDSWGTETDKNNMKKQFAKMKKFTDSGYGVVIGEYGVCKKKGSREVKEGTYEFFDNVVKLSKEYGYCPMIWDCNDWFSRDSRKFNYDELKDIYGEDK